jgi:hypothetical protein
MKTWPHTKRLAVILTLAGLMGCSRQVAVPESNGTATRVQLPFERVSDKSGMSPTDGFSSDGIPPGTEVAVRLLSQVSSEDSRPGDSFQAILEQPLTASGGAIVPQGTPVSGSVLVARASENPNDPGYLRLTLALMVVNGKTVPLHTSSIFVKGSYGKRKPTPIKIAQLENKAGELAAGVGNEASINPKQGDVRFSTGRRLNFRLAQPLHF